MASIKDAKVLVVDDSADVLIFVEALLAAEGIDVRTSMNAQDALALVLEADRLSEPFDLLITDLDMPKERGTVLIKAVRDLERQADVSDSGLMPILLLTSFEPGSIPPREGEDMMRLELSYLHKSATSERLIPMVRKILRRRSGPGG
ncbi:MAG: response regulator [bacterium]|nr:response regulator [bacterium]